MKSYVMITGAAGGLGKAFAAECAARGWDLFLTDLNGPRLQILADGLGRLHGVDIRCRQCDLTDPEERVSLWEAIDQSGLRFHMLINVAGVDFEGPFAERKLEELTSIVRLNIESVVSMTHEALGRRARAGTFRIINVSSLAGFYPMPIKAVYAASKRFLLDFSLALRSELRKDDVTVTVLCPAGLPTHAEALRGIEAQGFMGRVTTKNVGFVAARTIERALAGRAVYIPGTLNLCLRLLGGLVPPSVAAAFVGRRWSQARKSRADETAPPLEQAKRV